MKAEVLERIQELGGDVSDVKNDAPLKDQLASVRFNQVLFDDCWECYGIDEFLESNKQAYQSDRDAFVEQLLNHLLADNDEPRGQCFWRSVHFTPLTEGTEDHAEWKDIFRDYDLAEIREVAGDGVLEFVQIMYNYGYPDHYYVCLQDPNPENPTVFGTDHEVFFSEITRSDSLEEFLDDLLDRNQLKEIAVQYLEDEHGDA